MSGLKALHLENRPRLPQYKRFVETWNHVNNVWQTPPVVGYVCDSCQGRGCTVCGNNGTVGETHLRAAYAALKAKHKSRLRRWLDQRSMLNAALKRLSKDQRKLVDRMVSDHMEIAGKPFKLVDTY